MKFYRTSFFARDQRAFKLVPKSIKEEEWKGEGERERERGRESRGGGREKEIDRAAIAVALAVLVLVLVVSAYVRAGASLVLRILTVATLLRIPIEKVMEFVHIAVFHFADALLVALPAEANPAHVAQAHPHLF